MVFVTSITCVRYLVFVTASWGLCDRCLHYYVHVEGLRDPAAITSWHTARNLFIQWSISVCISKAFVVQWYVFVRYWVFVTLCGLTCASPGPLWSNVMCLCCFHVFHVIEWSLWPASNVVGSGKPMACAKAVQTPRCSFTNKKMQWLTWRKLRYSCRPLCFCCK